MAPAESTGKHPDRVAAGLKASIKNPNTSVEAKESASERLQEMGATPPEKGPSKPRRSGSRSRSRTRSPSVESKRVLGGYKATLNNANTSEEAKQHAREILEAAGYELEDPDESVHHTRVLAGYKAALHNPRVSAGAKQHAKEFLAINGAL